MQTLTQQEGELPAPDCANQNVFLLLGMANVENGPYASVNPKAREVCNSMSSTLFRRTRTANKTDL